MSNEIIEHEESQEMDDKSIQLAEEMELNLELTNNQLMSSAVNCFNSAAKMLVEAGLFLQKVKADCVHGEFTGLCEKHGFTKHKASEAMRYAQLAASLPKAKRNQILELPKKKVLALASIEPETVEQALDDQDFVDDIASMSYGDLRTRVKQLESKNADLQVDNETLKIREKDLKATINNKKRESGLPDYVEVTRHESNALATQAMMCGDGLLSLLSDLSTAMETGDPDLAKFNALGAASLLTQARAATAHMLHIYQTLQDSLGGIASIDDELPADALFSEAEIQQAIVVRNEMTRNHEQDRIIRENEREAKKPRRRGAPKKNKAEKK